MTITLTLVFAGLLILTTLTRIWLGQRHVRHIQAHRNAVPSAFAGNISLDAHQKAADYSSAKTGLVIAEAVAQAVLLMLFTLGGGLQLIDTLWREWLPQYEIVRGALVILSAFVISALVDLPFDYYRTFVVDQRTDHECAQNNQRAPHDLVLRQPFAP